MGHLFPCLKKVPFLVAPDDTLCRKFLFLDLRFVSHRDWTQKEVEMGQYLVALIKIERKPEEMIQCKLCSLGPELVNSLGLSNENLGQGFPE